MPKLDTRLPVVTCPGCNKPMVFKKREPLLFSDLDTVTFHCEKCGADTKRDVKKAS